MHIEIITSTTYVNGNTPLTFHLIYILEYTENILNQYNKPGPDISDGG